MFVGCITALAVLLGSVAADDVTLTPAGGTAPTAARPLGVYEAAEIGEKMLQPLLEAYMPSEVRV